MTMAAPSLSQDLLAVVEARHHDPFAVLGRHPEGSRVRVTTHLPQAESASVVTRAGLLPLTRLKGTDLFQWRGAPEKLPQHYRLRWEAKAGGTFEAHDPYSFGPQIGDLDLHLFGEGRHWHAYRFLGAHPWEVDGVTGVLFATWAPNAGRVSVVGDFNDWDGRRHPMRVRGGSGVWELFVPDLEVGAVYKLELRNRDTGQVFLKTDPYGRRFEVRPATAAIVEPDDTYPWGDADWMDARQEGRWMQRPLSIYEVHPGSWQRDPDGGFLDYRELARRLVAHVCHLGFTHIELLPITEHPFDGSWGYQAMGYFAPTSRFGTPDDFRYLVDHCHRNGVGVLVDWVPAHFPKDPHGLARFDGTPLYEHEDPRLGEHRDWGTLIFNFGRHEVKNFLLASALYWLEAFHLDGLRVDAVASMLYLDYSRNAGEWFPNIYGGRENLEAIAFVRELNQEGHGRHPGCMVIAEESTAWPMVSRPTWLGGLGFTMKWNMGWMHDTLEYFQRDPVYRHYHHQNLTFGLVYAFTENFVLPFSHDEVVHMKGSMLGKMPGDDWQQFANLRALYTYMYTMPGKKLLFMGAEFAQRGEWNHDAPLDWEVLGYPSHMGIARLVKDLNHLYRGKAPLHQHDFEAQGFEWLDCCNTDESVIAYLRKSDEGFLVVVLNLTPVVREDYRVGVPAPGHYREVLNSDSAYYWGTNTGNAGGVEAEAVSWNDRPHSVSLTLPPLAGVILEPAG
jgi:1,4-alpha-glucan branching enzyme